MKTRFAPSPTGLLHLGNARTALFSALYAKREGGVFLLRIEDTDKERSREEYITALCQDITWLEMAWQEGEGVGGSHGPYRQSERGEIYARYYIALQEQGRAYDCYCSNEELELERKLQQASGQPPRYSGKCKRLTDDEKNAKKIAGIKPALRFAVKAGERVEFTDLVKGKQSYKAEDVSDFIIRRNDGGSAFMFCNVIDDSLMGVTHVLRGEDHLTNTPRQLMILKALNLQAPQYGHTALINGVDGQPLSKRNGSRNIAEMRQEGFLPLAVMNYMARLGHYYQSNELMNFDLLAQHFHLERLSASAARFDPDQLLFWQRTAVQALGEKEFCNWIHAALEEVSREKRIPFAETIRDNVIFPADALRYVNILAQADFSSTAHADIIKVAGAAFFEQTLIALDQYGLDYEAISHHLTTALGVKGKPLFQPLRVALSGELHGPKLAMMMEFLGLAEVRARLNKALQQAA